MSDASFFKQRAFVWAGVLPLMIHPQTQAAYFVLAKNRATSSWAEGSACWTLFGGSCAESDGCNPAFASKSASVEEVAAREFVQESNGMLRWSEGESSRRVRSQWQDICEDLVRGNFLMRAVLEPLATPLPMPLAAPLAAPLALKQKDADAEAEMAKVADLGAKKTARVVFCVRVPWNPGAVDRFASSHALLAHMHEVNEGRGSAAHLDALTPNVCRWLRHHPACVFESVNISFSEASCVGFCPQDFAAPASAASAEQPINTHKESRVSDRRLPRARGHNVFSEGDATSDAASDGGASFVTQSSVTSRFTHMTSRFARKWTPPKREGFATHRSGYQSAESACSKDSRAFAQSPTLNARSTLLSSKSTSAWKSPRVEVLKAREQAAQTPSAAPEAMLRVDVLKRVKPEWLEKTALRLVSFRAAQQALFSRGVIPNTPEFEQIDGSALAAIAACMRDCRARFPHVWALNTADA